jgi:hypothetical protein
MSAHTAITIYGVVAVTFMMIMYSLERRHRLHPGIAVRRYLRARHPVTAQPDS